MTPDQLAALVGASDGGGDASRPPPSADALRAALAQSEADAALGLDTLARAIHDAMLAAEETATDGMATLGMAINNTIVAAAKKSEKGLDTVVSAIRDEMAESESAMHSAIDKVGGKPYILTAEAYADNQTLDPWTMAWTRIVEPALDQQLQQVAAGQDPYAVATESLPGFEAFTMSTVPAAFAGTVQSAETPPVPPTPPDPLGHYPDSTCVIGEPPGEDCLWVAPGATAPPVTPLPPPPESPPPPPVPGVTPDESACCPPQQIVVPAPVVNVYVGGEHVPPSVPTPPPVVSPPPPGPPPLAPSESPTAVTPPAGSWDGPGYCATIASPGGIKDDAGGLQHAIHVFAGAVGQVVSLIPLLGGQGGQIRDAIEHGLLNLITELGRSGHRNGIADPQTVTTQIASNAIGGFLNRWLGVDMSYPQEPSMQVMRYSSPVFMPGQAGTDGAYLKGNISKDTWECWTRANGNLPYAAELVMTSGRTIPGVGDAISLHRRKLISDEQYYAYARMNGVLDKVEADRLYKLSSYVPTASDIFRWLVKDSANEEYAIKAGLDDGFAESWNPQFQAWADANGITDQQIKYEYRSQWQNPSKTETTEMIRRLRPGRVDKSLVFTIEDALFYYKLDEVPSKLREQFVAISYLPIAQSYVQEMYKAGTIGDNEVVERMQDAGYSPADSVAMKDMVVAKTAGQLQAKIGAWTPRRISREYNSGTIDRQEAGQLLKRSILDWNKVQDALDDADLIRVAEAKGKCVKGIRRKYFTGEYTRAKARQDLLNRNVAQQSAEVLLDGWECERNARSKEPTVKMLTEWATQQIITVADFTQRLINLGYTTDDAQRIVNAAIGKFNQKQAKPKK